MKSNCIEKKIKIDTAEKFVIDNNQHSLKQIEKPKHAPEFQKSFSSSTTPFIIDRRILGLNISIIIFNYYYFDKKFGI